MEPRSGDGLSGISNRIGACGRIRTGDAALEPIRRRDGAVMWSFFSDIADPRRCVEACMVETWGKHVRQQYRGTASDSETC
jgi:hypothetical protein